MRSLSRIDRYHFLRLAALITLFTLLNYMGSALYSLAANLTSVKPFVGVGLALCLIYGRSWLWPVVISGTIGGIIAKLAFPIEPDHPAFIVKLFDIVATPVVTSASLLLTYNLLQRLVGKTIDFRAWKQLLRFIASTTFVSATLAFAFAYLVHLVRGISIVPNWLSWFAPLSLSYVIFTPVIVLLATTEKQAFRRSCSHLIVYLVMLSALLILNLTRLGAPLFFTIPLALLVITMACEIEGAALGLLLTDIILTGATVSGHGLAMLSGWALGYQLYFSQIVVSVLITVMLPVAAAITERSKLRDDLLAAAEREQRYSLALQQSQRLEAVGRLTSGVAHDFNNLLTVILGNADDLEVQLVGDERLHILANMTKRAALRAAEHTGQLLAFSRKQTLNIQAVDINKILMSVDSLLRAAVGERVEIKMDLATEPWLASVDIAQFESALMNLAANARDAMPNGGRLTIETRNMSAAEVGVEDPMLLKAGGHEPMAGQYVLVAVSDSGIGMDEDTRMRVFEPFFTTKDVGKGTGLGLSMVYGFIKQLGGHIRIRSERWHGTTVELYLPGVGLAVAGNEPLKVVE